MLRTPKFDGLRMWPHCRDTNAGHSFRPWLLFKQSTPMFAGSRCFEGAEALIGVQIPTSLRELRDFSPDEIRGSRGPCSFPNCERSLMPKNHFVFLLPLITAGVRRNELNFEQVSLASFDHLDGDHAFTTSRRPFSL